MLRRRGVLVLGVAALGLGARAALAAPAGALFGGSTSQSPEQAADWSISGTLQSINGQTWTVQGFVFNVNAATKLLGSAPAIGDFVSAEGIVLADGSWLALAVRIGRRVTPTPTSTSTPATSPTSTPSPTPTNTPDTTPTNTPVTTPTVTATVVSTRTPGAKLTARAGESGDDREDDREQQKDDKEDDREQRKDVKEDNREQKRNKRAIAKRRVDDEKRQRQLGPGRGNNQGADNQGNGSGDEGGD
jgi:hypothetical protein